MWYHSAFCQVLFSSSCARILNSVKSGQLHLLLVSGINLKTNTLNNFIEFQTSVRTTIQDSMHPFNELFVVHFKL